MNIWSATKQSIKISCYEMCRKSDNCPSKDKRQENSFIPFFSTKLSTFISFSVLSFQLSIVFHILLILNFITDHFIFGLHRTHGIARSLSARSFVYQKIWNCKKKEKFVYKWIPNIKYMYFPSENTSKHTDKPLCTDSRYFSDISVVDSTNSGAMRIMWIYAHCRSQFRWIFSHKKSLLSRNVYVLTLHNPKCSWLFQ